MKILDNCQWVPRWVTHLGCIKGCLNHLGIEMTDAWLFGGTGHAFVINVHEGVCPSGPTAWNTGSIFELGRHLGYRTDGFFASKDQPDFAEKQEAAWNQVRQAIDGGIPCYGWELEIPEFYVVYGYDDVGYYFSGPGCDSGKGPKPWQELADTGIGVLEMYSVQPGEAASDRETVKQALVFALRVAGNPSDWIFEGYRAGLAGYDNWIGALEAGTASDMGTRYNAGLWLECRRNAVGFLKEARERLPGAADTLFDQAAAHYGVVAAGLARVEQIYPWSHETSDEAVLPVDDTGAAAIDALKAARAAEEAGLQTLGEIIQSL